MRSARYARHVLLPEVGVGGQLALLAAAARIAGVGPAAEEATVYLAAAGVGRLVVAPSLGARLAARVAAMNPDVRLVDAVDAATAIVDVVPRDPERRAAGAEAALCGLLALLDLGAGAPRLEGLP
ncbi:MAG: hypothetical protein U1F43_00175 [Myxococcota bacterium]